nr:hypothetical protein BaRGS_029055 [Batillaria attramentaria]
MIELTASELELQYGTLSAFAMSSRWLLIPTVGDDLQLIPTRGDNLLDRLHLQNVTMDNVALVDQGIATKVCNSHHHFVLHTLMRTRQGRAWRPVNNVVTDSNSYNCGHCQSSTCSSSDDLGKLLFPNFSRGFHGRHIRVLAKGFTAALLSDTVNGRKTWTGVLADLLHVLSHTVNLTYDIVEPTEDVWGSGTAADADTGFYGHVIRHEVDLGLAPTELLPDRLKLMDFTHPVFYTSIVMVYRKQETRDLNMALVPFSNSVLVAIMGCLVTVTLSSEVPLRSRSGKVLLMSWWMFSLVMAAAYSSTLTAFLSVIKDRQLFSRLEDLHVQGVMLVVPVGVGLALMVLMVELLYDRRKQSGSATCVESVCDLNDLSHHVVQHMLVSGGEVLSGEWVKRMVKTGEDSWRPLNIVLMCSLPCIQSALQKASKLELKYGTQSAFPMSSHWLLIPTGGDNLLDYLLVHNVTMDNVALEVDLGLVLTDIILDRQVVMDFTDTVTYSSYVMVYRPPETTDELKTVLGPLSQWLLLAIGGALVAVTMALVVFELCACSDQGAVHGDIGCVGDVTVSQTLLTLDKVLHITGAALLSESSEVQMRSRSGKVLLMSWWMFSLVMAAAYSSTLTAFLSVTKDRQLFSRLEDLTSTLPLYKQLWAAIQRFAATDPDVISVNVTTIASKVRQGDFVAILPQPYAFTMICCSIRGLHSAGILSHWTAIWFPRVVCPSPPDSKVISLQHVQGVMMVVPVGVGLALLVLLVEILYVGRRAGRNQQMTGQ